MGFNIRDINQYHSIILICFNTRALVRIQCGTHGICINSILIEELLQQLSGREQQLIKMRYFENATQSQIAAKLGTSQVQVSRMEKKILLQMRKYMSQG